MHQADHDPMPAADAASSLREIPDPDAVAQAPDGPPPNVLIVNQTTTRGISPRAALAVLTLLLALGGLAARGLLSDWQGLWAESHDRWAADPAPTPLGGAAVAAKPAETADDDDAKAAEPDAPEPPAASPPGDLLAAAPAQEQPEAEPAPPKADDDDTQAALADIQQEVEHKRKEQEELDKLREQVEREAPPPAPRAPRVRRFGFAAPMPINPRDRQELARIIREQQIRQIQEMERIFDEIERAHAQGFQGWPPMMPRPNFELIIPPAPRLDDPRQNVPAPPEPGLPDIAPPPAWPGLNLHQAAPPRPRRNDNRA